MCDLSAPQFQDEETARKHLEAVRWPNGPVCPHCGGTERNYPIQADAKKKIRPGLYRCNDCNGQFTVTVGTVFESSKVPLNKWLMAVYLMSASKKGISSHQLHRMLGVTYKTAWFMTHRIREAMRELNPEPLGGNGGTVEIDETFWGNKKPRGQKKGRGYAHKEKIFTLVERGGKARSYHVPSVTAATLKPIIKAQVKGDTRLMTDEAGQYASRKHPISEGFTSHERVNHGIGEYVRGNVHTNTIESYFAILKRGLVGTFHHVAPHHLKRYVGEFDFRYNNRSVEDMDRAIAALRGIEGKRLMYRDSQGATQ